MISRGAARRVPIAITGAAPGRNQRSTARSCAFLSEMQPIVGPPVCAWRKIPEPLPGTTGRMLYSTTARYGYGRGCCHIPSLPPANGGVVPQATCWKEL